VAGEPTPGSLRGAGEQKSVAPVSTWPVGQPGQVKHLTYVAAEAKRAVRMQRQGGAEVIDAKAGRRRLDCEVVGDQRDRADVGRPLLQPPITSPRAKDVLNSFAQSGCLPMSKQVKDQVPHRVPNRATWNPAVGGSSVGCLP
jgi:hypothetical protein